MGNRCILSIDVEDWFHILDLPSTPIVAEWSNLPSRVEKNFIGLLDIVDKYHVKTTCFFLGWIAERFPHLVREAQHRGHEIASHGYAHRLLYEMSPDEFAADAARSKRVLEDICGSAVLGYRGAGFSTTRDTPWLFDQLARAGYRYDSSVFPARRTHGGIKTGRFAPGVVDTDHGRIMEFPITVKRLAGTPVCFFGGGYLRLFPWFIIREMGDSVLRENRPVVFYVHPREIDPGHPRLPMSRWRNFKSYVGLNSVAGKLENICSRYAFVTFEQYLSQRDVAQP